VFNEGAGDGAPNVRDAEFNDPRLVEVHDAESPWARDDQYFFALVDETPQARVLDVGLAPAPGDWTR
jgi:hypothetical protein